MRDIVYWIIVALLFIGVLLFIFPGWALGHSIWDQGGVTLKDRISVAVDNLKDDASENRIREAVRDQVSDRKEADRLADAISDARKRGVSRREIVRAMDDLEGNPNLKQVRLAIEDIKPKETPTAPTATAVLQATKAAPAAPIAPTATSGVVVVPTPGPGQPPQGVVSSGVCKLDKIGTWSETQSAQPYRIEVGGGGTQHADLYPKIGVKAISIVVPPQFPKIVFGFGSIWEGNGPECQSFDYAADAANYAKARMQNNHSGVAVDFRGGTGKIVGNAANLSVDQINGLLTGLGFPVVSQATTQTQPASVAQQAAPAAAPVDQAPPATVACQETREDRSPVVNQPWTPRGEFRIINFWSNQPGVNQQERKLLLKPGENPGLLGGGSSWSWPANCESTAQAEFGKNPKTEVSLSQLRAEGLAR